MELLAAIPNVPCQSKIDRIHLKEEKRGEETGDGRQRLGLSSGDEAISTDRTPIHGDGCTMPGVTGKSEERETGASFGTAPTHKETKDVAMTDDIEDVPRTNGVHLLPNGLHINGLAASPSEPLHQMTNALQKLFAQLPPEIAHSTLGYLSMSTLVGRLVQDTFNGLGDVINEMAEIPISQPQVNGNINHVNHRVGGQLPSDTSQGNIQKKRIMFEFANSRRAQFIKALVLSRWARQAEAISKVIDIRLWLHQKDQDYANAVHWMGELKRKVATAKEPQPDIKTALEVLSLGKASWIPDSIYLPSEQLSSQQILDGLRRINVLLSLRLNLYESIPPSFRNFSIASGRATFFVPEEFEVDVSIADEDTEKQLYFLDLRLIFAPAPPKLPQGRLEEEFQHRANDILGREGLNGLFEFLHNIVLTHKLTILRTQAFEMARGHWSDHLKVEPVRRSVVVQYWCDRPGAKHWIEIGIKRGKAKRIEYMDEEQRIPDISLRWFRSGKEIHNSIFDLRPADISMEYILKQVIAQHSCFIFSEMAAKLSQAGIYADGRLRLKCLETKFEPADASLLVQTAATKAAKIIQEPVSGRFAVLPAFGLNSRAEFELNRLTHPANDGASQISYLRALTTQEEMEAGARRVGWEQIRSLSPSQDTRQHLFPKGTQRIRFFRRASWCVGWAIAFATNLEGDSWWVVEMSERPTATDSTTSLKSGIILRNAYRVVTDSSCLPADSSHVALSRIEQAAARMISQFTDTRYLAASGISHRLQSAPSLTSTGREFSIYARLPTRQAPPTLRSPITLDLPWANEVVKINFKGLNTSHDSAIHLASAHLNQPFPNMKDLAANMPGAAFHPSSGAFALRFRTQIGEPSVPPLVHRIDAIGRLHNFIATIKAHKLVVNRFSMDALEFTYQHLPKPLKATIDFPADAMLRISLSSPNPHLRILDQLNDSLRTEGLAPVLALMQLTLPLLTALANLEATHSLGGLNILVRSEQWYQIYYSAPLAKGSFDIQLKQRRDDPKWLIPEESIKRIDPAIDDDEWQQSLREATRGKGAEWRGMSGGLVASLTGIQGAVEKLDAVFSSATRHTPQESRPGKRKADGEIVEID